MRRWCSCFYPPFEKQGHETWAPRRSWSVDWGRNVAASKVGRSSSRTALRELDFLGKREIGVAIETIVVKPGQIQTVTSCDSHILAWLPRSCNIKAEAANTGYTQIQHLKESLLVLQEFLY